MKTYYVQISDRQRARRINAEFPSDAVREAVGSRYLHHREESHTDKIATHSVAVSTGPTRSGSTPFKNIRVYISEE